MQIQVEFTEEDIVQILSDGMYGDDTFEADLPEDVEEAILRDWIDKDEFDEFCWEKKLAYALLHGYRIHITDNYSEELIDNWKPEGNGARAIRCDAFATYRKEDKGKWGHVVYEVGLEDFVRAAQTEEGLELIQTFMAEEDDFYTGWNYIQLVLFNEIIYG